MAAQGQSLFAAAGDSGAYDAGGDTTPAVDDPASQPYVTGSFKKKNISLILTTTLTKSITTIS